MWQRVILETGELKVRNLIYIVYELFGNRLDSLHRAAHGCNLALSALVAFVSHKVYFFHVV